MSARPPEGWYPDPDPELPGIDRRWNGTAWTDERRHTPRGVKTAGYEHEPGWYPYAALEGLEIYWDGWAYTGRLRRASAGAPGAVRDDGPSQAASRSGASAEG